MPFYAKNFVFDGIPSDYYNLYLGSLDETGTSTSSGSNNVELLTKKLFRNPKPLFWGVEQTPVLQFPLSVYCRGELTAEDYNAVSSWLFGQQEYKKLRICQPDMEDVYFNCFFTEPEVMRVGNMITGFTATVVCDSPWAWRNSNNIVYTGSTYGLSSANVFNHAHLTYYNESANNYYTYPTEIVIKTNAVGSVGSVAVTSPLFETNSQITFQNDTDDTTRLLHIHTYRYEVITINCELQTISSYYVSVPGSTTYLTPATPILTRLTSYKNFPRLLRGYNNLSISGNLYYWSMTCPIAIKIG